MERFLQVHGLTIYPPSNPNRDDLGYPKKAVYGNVTRLRLSSQSLKRAIRFSSVFEDALKTYRGLRTRRIGQWIKKELDKKFGEEEKHASIATVLAKVWGKPDEKKELENKTLAFISPAEMSKMIELAMSYLDETDFKLKEILSLHTKTDKKSKEKMSKKMEELGDHIMRRYDSAVDIGMFGRMLADSPKYNREAAVQVSHAITTHAAQHESDYWTGVEDLMQPSDTGSAHLDNAYYGSGVFYTYACIDRCLLLRNLDDDEDLMRLSLRAFVHAFATATPSGKRNSFANHTHASYLQASLGPQQPFSLAGAFLRPVKGDDLLQASIDALEKWQAQSERVYGPSAQSRTSMNTLAKQSATLHEVMDFSASSHTCGKEIVAHA